MIKKKNSPAILFLVLLCGLSAVTVNQALFAQERDTLPSGVLFPDMEEISGFILRAARTHPSGKKPVYVDFTPYTLNEQRCGYGDYLSAALRSRLAASDGNIVSIRAGDYLPALRQNKPEFMLPDIDYLIAGKLFRLGTHLRIQTIIIDPAAGLITAVHDSSVAVSQEMLPLLANDISAGQSDLFEPDGPENPTVLLAGESGNAHTLTAGDEDWYVYTAERDGIITFRTTGSLDTTAAVYGPDDTGNHYRLQRRFWRIRERRPFLEGLRRPPLLFPGYGL